MEKTPRYPRHWGAYEKWVYNEWKGVPSICKCGYELNPTKGFYRPRFCKWCVPVSTVKILDPLIQDPADLDHRFDPPRYNYLVGVHRHPDVSRPPDP